MRMLICGSSVMTVIYMPESTAGVAVNCRACAKVVELDAKYIPRGIRSAKRGVMMG
jgi:hypothetical protein